MRSKYTLITLFIFLSSLAVTASTIVPYRNLAEMTKYTETVVKVKTLRQVTADINNTTRTRFEVEVENVIKGDLNKGEKIYIQNYHLQMGNLERVVADDVNLENGVSYVLFLAEMDVNVYTATMLTYGVLEEVKRHSKSYLIPIGMGLQGPYLTEDKQTYAEDLVVYNSATLVSTLKRMTENSSNWNQNKVKADLSIQELVGERMLPSYCSYVFSSNITIPGRWEDIEQVTEPLVVYTGINGDANCSNEILQINNAISAININYLGLSLFNGGTHNFTPPCGDDGATGDAFIDYIDANYDDYKRLLIQFDDPCNDIPPLGGFGGCNGTLAFAGSYMFSTTYTYEGNNYRNLAYGYTIVNEGTGACQCGSSDYEIMMTHEMTHTLNIGHIDDNNVANMNGLCCNDITQNDRNCVDFLYPFAALPIELKSFVANANSTTVDLEWTSSSEVNNSFYTLERKTQGGEFVKIAKVESLGDSKSDLAYNYKDLNPSFGMNIYRLSQTDLDGTRSVLDVKSATIKGDFRVEVIPNPIQSGQLSTYINSDNDGSAIIEVLSATGKVISKTSQSLTRGLNTVVTPMNGAQPGIYFLSVKMDGVVTTRRFMKS